MHRPERGQILVIGAVALVVLIGIGGLVIDLGFSWILRRSEQNAVDPATIAAARYIPEGNVDAMEEAACFYARANGFFPNATAYDLGTDGCVPANDPDDSELTVNWPPDGGDYDGDDRYVQVILTSSHDTFFSRIFGFGSMGVTTAAVAANGLGEKDGGQLVALDPTSCGAGQIRGGGTVSVSGSIYVNSDGSGPPSCIGAFDNTCSGSDGAFRFSGSTTRLISPHTAIRGTCGQNANPYPNNCSPPSSCGLSEGAPQIDDPFQLDPPPLPALPAPGTSSSGPLSLTGCDGPGDDGCTFGGAPGSWYELNPGLYYGGWTITREVRLNPGLYYIAGGGIQVSSEGRIVTINPITDLPDGEGRILLYSTDGPSCASAGGRKCQGTIVIEGSGGFEVKGYEGLANADPTDDAYHRLLIWQAEGTSKTWDTDSDFSNDKIRIAGSGNLDFWGTIYAPKSLVEIQGGGAGTGTAGVEILAWRFDIGGDGTLTMPYDEDELAGIFIKGLVQ